jgi:hypothetical protein
MQFFKCMCRFSVVSSIRGMAFKRLLLSLTCALNLRNVFAVELGKISEPGLTMRSSAAHHAVVVKMAELYTSACAIPGCSLFSKLNGWA